MLFYVIYTFLGFVGIDAIVLGYVSHLSLLPWIYLYLSSFVFKFCYVHRLPLYYVALNEIVTTLDNYLHIPISDFNLLILHSIILSVALFGYTFYYLIKNERLR